MQCGLWGEKKHKTTQHQCQLSTDSVSYRQTDRQTLMDRTLALRAEAPPAARQAMDSQLGCVCAAWPAACTYRTSRWRPTDIPAWLQAKWMSAVSSCGFWDSALRTCDFCLRNSPLITQYIPPRGPSAASLCVFSVTPPLCPILIWFVMNTTPPHPPPALQLYLDALKLVTWWKMESFFILNLWLDGRINLLSGQQRSSPPLNLPQVPLYDFISVLRLRRWLEKTERKKKQTEVVNLLNSLTRFAVSAASAERVLIARFCTWKPDRLYTLNGFWVKSRKPQYGICISSRILYSRLYIEALTLKRRKTNTFSLVASFDLEVSPSCVRLSNDPSTKKKKISIHSELQLVHTLAGGAMCGEPVWSTQVGVWFGI